MFDKLRDLARKVVRALNLAPSQSKYLQGGREDSTSTSETSVREREMPLDRFTVKRKLGRAWFTRRLNARTRRRRLMEMSSAERAIAREEGWL